MTIDQKFIDQFVKVTSKAAIAEKILLSRSPIFEPNPIKAISFIIISFFYNFKLNIIK